MRFLVAPLCAVALILAAAGEARALGEDSPWPRTDRIAPNVHAIRSVVADLEADVELMQWSADRYADWQACLRGVPVSEYGSYLYDERDGTSLGYTSALAVDRKRRPRKEDYLFLSFSRKGNCRTAAPQPGGTAEPATAARASTLRATVRNLERRVTVMKRAARRLETSSERFDAWESCVSWVPVTEYGDPEGTFGYVFEPKAPSALSYRPALAVDRSEWDDPDYMFLAFVGGDRPGRQCQDEPGEGVD